MPDLLERARSPERAEREAAFAELFASQRGPVLGLCRNLLGNSADAEDALQEIFLCVHQGLASFRGEAQLGTWIYRIAIRVATRLAARRGRRQAAPLVSEPAAPEASTGGELSPRLARAMAELPLEQRLVLALFAQEGLNPTEIAAILGIPVGTVWSRLHKARKTLQRRLRG